MDLKAWIQSSNEKTEDFVLRNGKLLSVDDEQRKEYVNLMFDVKNNGRVKFRDSLVEIFQDKNNDGLFLVEMNADNKDIYERKIAVMLLIEDYQRGSQDELSRLIDETFSNTDPKTEVSETTKQNIIKILEKAKKKK